MQYIKNIATCQVKRDAAYFKPEQYFATYTTTIGLRSQYISRQGCFCVRAFSRTFTSCHDLDRIKEMLCVWSRRRHWRDNAEACPSRTLWTPPSSPPPGAGRALKRPPVWLRPSHPSPHPGLVPCLPRAALSRHCAWCRASATLCRGGRCRPPPWPRRLSARRWPPQPPPRRRPCRPPTRAAG